MKDRADGIYRAQRSYFRQAYETGCHGWPTEGVSPMIARFLRRRSGATGAMLDIGCGEGRHTAAFADAGYRAVGLDREAVALVRARARPPSRRRPARWVQGDVFALPFVPSSFDVVVDYGCLHHVRLRDTDRYLEEVTAMVRPEGYLLLSCFSTKFKHHPGERRTRNWLVHRGHYDRFFRRTDFGALFGRAFELLEITEDRDGLYVFFNVMMRKRSAARGAKSASSRRRAGTNQRADADHRVR